MRQKNIYFDKMMRLRQKQSKTMRLSDLEQTDVLKERRLRENRDSMEKPILKIQNLNLYFTQYARGLRRRELHPLRDLSCKLFSGELTAVVGASGSGKSLLAHAILGILPYNCRMEGKISYQGEVLDETRLAGLRGNGISLIPQGVSYLDPLMRVGDQICGGRKDEATRAKCRQLLKRYGLDESVEKCYPFELSGGMARRVLMAAALMQEPRLIVADEPTPGLEAMTARHVIRHLKEMAQDGAAVLLITVYVIGNRGIQTGISSVTGRTVSDGAPMIAWVQMGLEESKRGPGWYNGYQVKLFQKADGDADLAAAWAQADLRRTISDMAGEPAKAADFFVRKIESIWAEPTLQSLCIQEVGNTSWAEGSPPWELFKEEGGLNRLYVFAANLVQTFVYAMACVWVIAGMSAKGSRSKHVLMKRTWEKRIEAEKAEKTVKAVKKQGMETVWESQERGEPDRWGMLLPGIVFIGGFLFHLVWEAKGQYSVVYFMLLLPYAYLGMERVADVFLDVTGAGKE